MPFKSENQHFCIYLNLILEEVSRPISEAAGFEVEQQNKNYSSQMLDNNELIDVSAPQSFDTLRKNLVFTLVASPLA